ncbi:MAG: 23S rRNA (guanosine(2251)-2'-O)-methyltransferase RlmB [Gaiellales bacterium]
MIVYGQRPVREAIRGPRRVLQTWEGLPADELERICGSPDHQGICAEVEEYTYADPHTRLADEDAIVLALDEVQDPHNLGAVIRSAEGAGASGIAITERNAARVTPAVCKASAGAVEHLPVARVRNLADWLGESKEAGAWVYGASPDGIPYEEPDYGGRVVLVLGSEGKGLRPRVAQTCDELVALPVRGKVESLNVATAAAALAFGILQFRMQS